MPETPLQRHPDALWTEFDRQVVVLGVATGRYFETQGVGGELWRLLERPRTGEELVDALTRRYVVDRAQAERDVAGFIQALRRAGLLLGPASAPSSVPLPPPVPLS